MTKNFTRASLILMLIMTVSCVESSSGDQWNGPGFYKKPEEIIKSLEKESSDYRKNFVMARAYKEKKELKTAILYYTNSAFRSKFNFDLRMFPQPVYTFLKGFHLKSPYYNDSVYEIASLFADYGEHEYVKRFIDLIKEDSTFLYRDAIILKSRSMSRLSDDKGAIAELTKLASKFSDSNSMALINIRLASIYENLNDYSKAADSYFNIISARTDQWQDNIASRRLAALMESGSIGIEGEERILLLSEALLAAGEIKRANLVLGKLKDSDKSSDSDRVTIKALTMQNRAHGAAFLRGKESLPHYDGLVLEYANTLWDTGARHEAVRYYREIAESEKDEIARRVMVRLIFFYEERNRDSAITFMNEFAKRFPGDDLTGRLLWMTGRHYLRDGNYSRASEYFRKSIEAFPAGEYSANSRYWLYLIESSGKSISSERRDQILDDLCFYNPESAYTLKLLKEELSAYDVKTLQKKYDTAKAENNQKRMHLYHTKLYMKTGYTPEWEKRLLDLGRDLTDPYRSVYNLISNLNLKSSYKNRITDLEKYFQTGDIAAVNRELKSIPQDDDAAALDIAAAMAVYSHKYGHHNYSTHYGFRLLNLLKIQENTALLPRYMSQIIYPLAFRECVEKESAVYNIPPHLIYSVIKAESNYIPEAVSSAGATGLMQLMPPTAAGIARQIKITRYDLKDPCTSIKFGTNYIAWLNSYFKGQIEYMVAGYNAGPGNVNKWIERFKTENMDYFAEFAPFAETRGYIYRTIKFSIQYESIYR